MSNEPTAPKTRGRRAAKPLSEAMDTARKHIGGDKQKQDAGDTSKQGASDAAPAKTTRAKQKQDAAPAPKKTAASKQKQDTGKGIEDKSEIKGDGGTQIIENGDGGSNGIDGGQQQDAGDTSKQGGGDAVVNLTEIGQKQMIGDVEIVYERAQSRGAEPKPETYPFTKLGLGKIVDGQIEGPSFFIPDADNPEKHLTAARKGVTKRRGEMEFLYAARKATLNGAPGKRVWKLKNEKFT